MVRREADPAEADRDRRGDAANPLAELRADDRAAHEAALRVASAREPEDGALAPANASKASRRSLQSGLAAVPTRLDEAGGPQPTDVPADERLREPDLFDELA